GNNSVFTGFCLTFDQLIQIRAKTSANKTWTINLRTSKRNNTLNIQFTGGEQLTDSDHILVTDSPHEFVRIDRVKEMNMSTRVARRMHTRKSLNTNVATLTFWQLRTFSLAHKYFAFGQASKQS